MGDLLLNIEHLSIEFHDKNFPDTVLDNFSMSMEQGEIVGIVGESGSGKTMTALAVAGLLKKHAVVSSGAVRFRGTELLTCSKKKLRDIQGRELSMIFQNPMTSLNPVMKIGPQIEESLRIHLKLSSKEYKRRALEAMKDVELPRIDELYGVYPHELSGGMRQRVMIAIAAICKPKLLIADEATTALDVTVQGQILQLLKKMNRENQMGLLFISHDLGVVSSLCERVLVMRNGKLVEEGKVSEIFRNPTAPYTKELLEAIPGRKRKRSWWNETQT